MEGKEQIRKLVEEYCAAVSTQDEGDFRSLWTQGGQTLISIPKVYEGTDVIYREFLLGVIREKYEKIELITEDLQINLLSDALAIAIFRYHTECVMRDSGEPYGIAGVETQLFVKENGQWKLCHLHYSKE